MSVLTGYESAGVSYVNGERMNENNANPYANANAPPVPAYPSDNSEHHRSSFGNNLGYPPYPNNPGSSAHGYPPYPQSTGRHQDLGYPPYPTQNRMPTPGQSAYPGYPQNTGYPQAPANYPQHPGYQNYPYQNYPNQRGYNYNSNSNYRRNAATVGTVASIILVGFSGFFLLVTIRW